MYEVVEVEVDREGCGVCEGVEEEEEDDGSSERVDAAWWLMLWRKRGW